LKIHICVAQYCRHLRRNWARRAAADLKLESVTVKKQKRPASSPPSAKKPKKKKQAKTEGSGEDGPGKC